MVRRKKPHGGRKIAPEKAERLIAVFRKVGYEVIRQRGSHLIMAHPDRNLTLAIPVHRGRMVQPEIIRELLKNAELSRKEYFDLL